MTDWIDIGKMLIDRMVERGYPESVATTVAGAIEMNRDKAEEIAEKVLACTTPREAVKAVQPYF